MEEKYCVFLRGINVNGISIKMDALKEAFIKMGFTDAKTILATGNVIFTLTERNNCGQESKSCIEKELSKHFLYDAHIIVRSSREIQDVIFVAQTMDVQKLMILECGVFWIVPKGATLSSNFGSKVLGNKKYKSRLTSRNINTIQKIYKAMMD